MLGLPRRAFCLLPLALAANAAGGAEPAPPQEAWVATWAASPHAADPDPDEPLLNIDHQTVRQRVRLSIGGKQLRVRLSNEHGSLPITIGSATVALPADPQTVQGGSLRSLTFDGRNAITLPPGAPVLSDAVDLDVPVGAEISISLFFPQRVRAPTLHALALKRAIVTARGDFTRAERVEQQAASESSILLSAVLVPARQRQRLVVAFGDSITDGDGSTVDADANWPSVLSRRLNRRSGGAQIAVVNAGVAGNRLLSDGFGIKALGLSALARFDRDVLTLPGVTHVILHEGVNDLGFPGATLNGQALAGAGETRSVADVIGAYRQLIARARAHGVKVIGATLTPFEGVDVLGYYSHSKESARQAVNTWIRTSGAFDGIIDFDAVLRDKTHPSRMQNRYSSPDHLHPNDAGYQAMAEAIDLSLFDRARESARLFELNIYHARPGKAPALEARFREASELQARHGLDVLGYWMSSGEKPWSDTLIYLVAHSSRSEAERRWNAFHADPLFEKYVASEQSDPLIDSVDTVYLRPTEYSRIR